MFYENYNRKYITTDDACICINDISMMFLKTDDSTNEEYIIIYRVGLTDQIVVKNNILLFNGKETTLFKALISSMGENS